MLGIQHITDIKGGMARTAAQDLQCGFRRNILRTGQNRDTGLFLRVVQFIRHLPQFLRLCMFDLCQEIEKALLAVLP